MLITLSLPIRSVATVKPFHWSLISSLRSIIPFSCCDQNPDVSQLEPSPTLRRYLLQDQGETESFNKWASFSCSRGEVYPHLSQPLTPGRERGQCQGQRSPLVPLYARTNMNPNPTQRSVGKHCSVGFWGPRMCEVNRSCALRHLPAPKNLKGSLQVF